MKGGRSPLKLKAQPKGYTVVEVMIVLAVSGMMFLMAVTFINGKQQKTAFTQGTNELGSRIQKMVDDVTNGHYSDVPLSCNASGSVSVLTSGDTQGTNSNCVFLGKVMHFYASGTGQPVQKYEVISMADLRGQTDDNFPRASIKGITGLTTQQTIPQGLELSGASGTKGMQVFDAGAGAYNDTAYSIGFIQGSGSFANAANGEYKNGAQTIRMVFSAGTNQSGPADTSSAFGMQVHAASSAKICVTDGKRYAQILIGDQNGRDSQLNIRVKQLGETACPTS